MDEATRLQYLQAMGIDVWVPRHQADSEPMATESNPNDSHQAWTDLQHQVSQCQACDLCKTRTQTVFGVGNHHATWLLIGEAPGQNEDLQGEPFVGKAGQLLNEMLRAIGLEREQVYIANMLKCRPPNNRDPQADEVAACNGFLQQQIALLQPKIILAVGRIAAQNLLKTQQPLSRLRGTQHQLDGIPLVVVHHPAYLLRSLTEKAKAWEDLQFAWSIYQTV
jgi:DNA polymerase